MLSSLWSRRWPWLLPLAMGGQCLGPSTRTAARVTVIPPSAHVYVGDTLMFAAIATDSSGVIIMPRGTDWSSNNGTVMAIANVPGLIPNVAYGIALAAGTANIMGQDTASTFFGVATVIVTDTTTPPPPDTGPPPIAVHTVEIIPLVDTVTVGSTIQFRGIGRNVNGDSVLGNASAFVWSAIPGQKGTVTQAGLLTTHDTGQVAVTMAYITGAGDETAIAVVQITQAGGPPPPPADTLHKFIVGDAVVTTKNTWVRADSSSTGTILCTQPLNATGTVEAGPIYSATDFETRYKVNFASSCDGWTIERWIERTNNPPPPPPTGVARINLRPSGTTFLDSLKVGATTQLCAFAVKTDSSHVRLTSAAACNAAWLLDSAGTGGLPPEPPLPPPPGGTCAVGWPVGVPVPMPESQGDTFYIAPNGNDNAAGSVGAPWATVGKAFSTLTPGQVAMVRPGNYGGDGVQYTYNTTSGSYSTPITVQGFPDSARPHLRAALIINGDFLRVRRVVLEGNGTWGATSENGQYPIYMNTSGTANYFELSYSEVYHSMKHSGISEYGTNIFIIGNYVHDNGAFSDPSTFNLSHGLYIHPTENLVMADNLFEHNRAKGVSGRYDAHKVWVLGNTFAGNDRSGIDIVEQAHDFLVANNIFINNGNVDGGIGINLESSGANMVQDHNVSYHNGTSGNSNWTTTPGSTTNSSANPLLVNPSSSVPGNNHAGYSNDYHISSLSSPAIGYANRAYLTPQDITGVCRNPAKLTVGAYEYVP